MRRGLTNQPAKWGSPRLSLALFLILSLLLASCGGGGSKRKAVATPTQVATSATRISDTKGASNSLITQRHRFTSSPVVYLDPGHGSVDTGTQGYTDSGQLVYERTVVLQIALRTATLLRQDGITVVMTRTTPTDPCALPSDYAPGGGALSAEGVLNDLQCRINKANAAHAQVLLSIHMNAYSDPSVGGTETFYDSTRSFGAENEQLANLIQNHLMQALHSQGYTTPDRGITDDTQLQAESMGTMPSSYDHLVMLGPGVPGKLTPSDMPGALCEVFFLSDPAEATAVVQPQMQNLVANAFTLALEQFLMENGVQ